MDLNQFKRLYILLVGIAVLVSCGGSSNSTSPTRFPTPDIIQPEWNAGQFLEQVTFKDFCATPRTAPDSNGDTFQDELGTDMHEKMWLRSWTDDTYLWYSEVDDNEPTSFSVAEYFSQLKTNELTASGSLKDNFHFTQSTEEYNQRAQSGVSSGYGISWEFVSASAPRRLIVRYTEPDSPAEMAGVMRGYELQTINGVNFINASSESEVDQFNAALFPSDSGQTFNFVFTDASNNVTLIADLTSANVELQPVQNIKLIDTLSGTLGYMQFNSFIRAGQDGLIDGFQQFVDANVTELVIDLRYNGGGLLTMASQLAYMIAGSAQTNNQIFETIQFNDKSAGINPVTGNPSQPTPFYTREINWDTNQFTNRTLPSLDLTRVFVLSTDGTCSASEAVINGLRGIDVDVVLIGDITCGKPYGFYAQDNCSTTYFTIQFQGVNAKNFGEYSDGFKPMAQPSFEDQLPGCSLEDDFTNILGDENEALLAASILYMETGVCPIQNKPVQKSLGSTSQNGPAIKTSNTIFESIILESKLITPMPSEPKSDN
jgi:C-terminal processing protease CtpA/Prc